MDMTETWRSVTSDPVLVRIGWTLAVLIIALTVNRLIGSAINRRITNLSLRYGLRKGVTFFVYLIAAIAIIATFSNGWGELAVVFGVAGAGIAFALQEVIASVAGWIALSAGAFYKPGDRVKVGGIVGDVIDIGVLRTTLMETGEWVNGDLYNGRVVRIANSFIFKEPVSNYSADFPFLWDELRIPIRYGSDWRNAESIMLAAAAEVTADLVARSEAGWDDYVQKYLIERARVEPMVTMSMTGDWIEITLRYITGFKSRRTTKDQICRRVLEGFERAGSGITLGATTFEILGVSQRALDGESGRAG